MAVVYWIHAPHHTDMTKEGYIGVTVQPEVRFQQHRSNALKGSTLAVHKAIRKYGSSIQYEILVVAEEDYCYELEGKLRPLPGIGYNAAIGYLNPKCNKQLWADAQRIHDAFHSVGGCGNRKLSTLLARDYSADSLETIANKLKDGWNPGADARWLEFVSQQAEA